MKINYKETINSLSKRIEIHKRYGTKDINKWMLGILDLRPDMYILDLGCGTGEQSSILHKHLNGRCKIIGADMSRELLEMAKTNNNFIKFEEINFNEKLPYSDGGFDLVISCFALYYAEDPNFTVKEIHRILKPNGKLFATGPRPNNKQKFYNIIEDATSKNIPFMVGKSRFNSEVLEAIRKIFKTTKIHEFRNPLVFKELKPFIEYVEASLSEDRKLWSDFFIDGSYDRIIEDISSFSKQLMSRDGQIIITKIVGGFEGIK